jgi:hypothetical protein
MTHERRSTARAACLAAERERRSANLLWVRNVRVSAAELASWQLGPDLTRNHLAQVHGRRFDR